MDHTWLRVVRLYNKNLLFVKHIIFGLLIMDKFLIYLWYHLEISINFDTQNTLFIYINQFINSICKAFNITIYTRKTNEL